MASLHVRRIVSAVALGSLWCVACGSAAPKPDACDDLGSGVQVCGARSVKLALLSDVTTPAISARVNGRELRMLVDTGAQASVVSASWLGVAGVGWQRTSELCFGELCFHGEQVYAEDTEFSQPDPERTNGFIGMRTLQHLAVELEGASSVTFSREPPGCSGAPHVLTYNTADQPLIDVTIDGHDLPATPIDTGSTFSVLSQASFSLLEPYVAEQSQPADLCTVDGCQTGVAHTSSVNQYCVAGVCRSAVPVKYPVFDGVGTSFLTRTTALFDFPHSTLTFCE